MYWYFVLTRTIWIYLINVIISFPLISWPDIIGFYIEYIDTNFSMSLIYMHLIQTASQIHKFISHNHSSPCDYSSCFSLEEGRIFLRMNIELSHNLIHTFPQKNQPLMELLFSNCVIISWVFEWEDLNI